MPPSHTLAGQPPFDRDYGGSIPSGGTISRLRRTRDARPDSVGAIVPDGDAAALSSELLHCLYLHSLMRLYLIDFRGVRKRLSSSLWKRVIVGSSPTTPTCSRKRRSQSGLIILTVLVQFQLLQSCCGMLL